MNTLPLQPTISARGLLLAMIVAAATVACQAGVAAPGETAPDVVAAVVRPPLVTPAAVAASMPLGTLFADLQAARRWHDTRAYHAYRARLTARLGASAVARADVAYRQAVANLDLAEKAHDVLARARYRAALHRLCDDPLVSAIESCGADQAP